MMEHVNLRKFLEQDVPNKVRWINDSENNIYLHYQLPLEEKKTYEWYKNIADRNDRYDAVIEYEGIPVGIIGLLNIQNKKAEYYITIGEKQFKGKGIAKKATLCLLEYAFGVLKLNEIYLYTEEENKIAQNLFEKCGFQKQYLEENSVINKGKSVNRFFYTILKTDFEYRTNIFTHVVNTNLKSYSKMKYHLPKTVIHQIETQNNYIYVKREDLIPISFGGNKARKAMKFFEVIDKGNYDMVVTYGSSSSNHCRIVANMAIARGMECYIIAPKEASETTFNSKMMELFGAQIRTVPVEMVYETIEQTLNNLKEKGKQPYFIQGGGHGNIGTEAFVECYQEICEYEKENNLKFDYIFLASGTGTTQAGLVCGQLLQGDERKIVGISIARKNPKGREVVLESIREYLKENNIYIEENRILENTIFCDAYISDGYGKSNADIETCIKNSMKNYGIPLDSTYTGKAFWGMQEYIRQHQILHKNILFIHTGGTPLFFDTLGRF